MLKETKAPTVSQFLTHSFCRVSPAVARKICETAKVSTRASTRKCGRHEADQLYRPSRRRRSGPGDRLHRADRRGVDPARAASGGARRVLRRGHAAAVRLSRQSLPHRGRPGLRRDFAAQKVPREALHELLEASDARTLRQFLSTTFDGVGAGGRRQDHRRRPACGRACRRASSRRPKSPSSTRQCGTSTCTTASR